MSEEAKIFRGDHGPESGPVESVRTPRRPPRAAPVAPPAPAVPEPEQSPVVPHASAPQVAPAPKPEPALDFHVDDSQLWHSSEAVKQRINAMAAAAHETAHVLDEQAAEAERIAKQLKSL